MNSWIAIAADLHRARLRPQPRALALRARPHRHVLLDLLARPVGVRLLVAALEVGDDPLERRHVRALAAHPVAVGDVQPVAVGAVQEEVLLLLRQVLPRRVEVDLVALGDRLRDLLVVARRPARPRQDRALVDRQRRVRHHELGVDLHLRAEPGAARARAVRRVERERPRLELGHRDAAVQAGEALRVRRGSATCRPDRPRGTVSISTIPSASATAVSTESASRLRRSRRMTSRSTTTEMSCLYFLSRTISSSSRRSSPSTFTRVKPSPRSSCELLAVLALAAAHDRRQDHEPRALLQPHDLVDDLLGRLRGDRAPAVEAVRLADPRPQQAQVVVDLGDRADRRPWVARRRLLVDRDRRRQPLDRVHVRLVHLPEELARVGAQRLDVAALALGVDRVERQRGLARAGQAGDDDQRVARQRRR